jgi:small subunit ribosomal protein S9
VTEEVSVTTPDHEPEQLADEAVAAEAVADEAVAAEAVETTEADAVAEFDAAVESDTETEAAPAPAPVALPNRLIQTVGRRKEAIVRVRLVPGSGKFTLNGKSLEQYFPNKVHQQLIKEPLVTVERTEMFDVIGNLVGGGISGQAGALRLAIARALIEFESEDRPALKKAGFLTRDPRAKERKKYGLKKARKAPQYSKR